MREQTGTAIVKLAVCLLAVIGMSLNMVMAQESLTADEIKELRRLLSKQSKENRLSDIPLDALAEPLSIGGYADIHANLKEDSDHTGQIDIHRLVFMVNYEFSKHIKLFSETEIEHAFVNDGDGEISIEQLYIDFAVTDSTSIHAGRVLVPLGIINANHEPTTFNGVERPDVDKYLIPSTWSLDGIGVKSQFCDTASGVIYLGGGLDGSEFSSTDGFRGGRIKERASLREPMVVGRMDWRALQTTDPDFENELRIGISGAYGGVNNENKGGSSNVHGEFYIFSADYDYRLGALALRGEYVQTYLSNAEAIGVDIGDTIAREMLGWYQEVAFHYLPTNYEGGRMGLSDANIFVRYEEFDTQYRMPSGVAANGEGTRDTWTFGAQWWFTRNLVIKADYQVRNDHDADDLDDLINLGIGLVF